MPGRARSGFARSSSSPKTTKASGRCAAIQTPRNRGSTTATRLNRAGSWGLFFVVDIRHQHLLVSTSDTMTGRPALDLLQGTLDLLILRTLESGPRHGWDISDRIQHIS